MELFKIKFNSFKSALNTLSMIIDKEETDILRDASIQRFEYSFELAWKTMKYYLKISHGIVANSPKSVFRESYQVDLIDEKLTQILLLMTEARNETVHLYNSEQARKIYNSIKNEFFPALVELIEKIKNGINE